MSLYSPQINAESNPISNRHLSTGLNVVILTRNRCREHRSGVQLLLQGTKTGCGLVKHKVYHYVL